MKKDRKIAEKRQEPIEGHVNIPYGEFHSVEEYIKVFDEINGLKAAVDKQINVDEVY